MARSSQSGDGPRTRNGVTVAELLSRQPRGSIQHHRLDPASAALSLPRRLARGAREHRRRVVLGGVAVLVVAGLSILGILGVLGIPVRQPANHGIAGDSAGAVLPARQWLDAYASGVVLTDGGFRAQLLHAGWEPGRVRTAAACTSAACPGDWLVSTPALRAGLAGSGPLDSAVRDSTPVAVFGSGADRVEIRHPGEHSAEQAARDLRARAAVGQALARVPRIAVDPGVRVFLDTGRVDPRVLAVLASLAQRGAVRVLELPAIPGEDAAGQPRREMLLALAPDGTADLTEFFAAQSGPYRPLAIIPTPAGVLVRYAPVAPPNLLEGFEGR